jgi:hypothetical protein
MKLRHVPLAALAAFAVAACGGGGEDYPPEVADSFLSSCTSGGTSRAVCQCALDKMEAEYNLEEFTEESTRFAQGRPSEDFSQDILQFSIECQREEG